MSSTSHVSASAANFRLTQRVVNTIVEEYKLPFEEVWSKVSSQSVEKLEKKFRTKRRNAWKLLGVKGAKSSYMFFCEAVRPDVVKKHPNLKVTEISTHIGKMWSKIKDSTSERKKYDDLAVNDRARYTQEKAAAEVKRDAETPQQSTVETPDVVPETNTVAKTTRKTTRKTVTKTATKTAPATTPATAPATTPATAPATKAETPTGSFKVFQKQMVDAVKAKHPKEKSPDITKRLHAMWDKLSANKRANYVEA